jgi:hypothetical protein
MQDLGAAQEEEAPKVDSAPDWTPWGQPRRAEDAVETAFHHQMVLIREAGGPAQIAKPGDVFVGAGAALEWSPMLWAMAGRRPGRTAGGLATGRTFVGEGERLFTTINAVCEQLFEGGVLGDPSRDRWIAMLENRRAVCEARAIAYRHLIVPEGHAIYAEAIPGAPRLSPNRPLQRILAAAPQALRDVIVYPLDALVDGRAKADTSQPHDIHVTGYGAYLIYRALVRTLPMIDEADILREEDLRTRSFLHAGDVARAAGWPARRLTMHERPPFSFKTVVKGESYRTHQVDVMESEDARLPRLVMFRTSNSSRLFPYLLKHFSRIVAVASNDAFYDLIESERPDAVVAEMPERYFAPNRQSPNATDYGAPPGDRLDEFERLTGHALPLPGAISQARSPAP